jgi:hypothetical protein
MPFMVIGNTSFSKETGWSAVKFNNWASVSWDREGVRERGKRERERERGNIAYK